MQPRAFGRVPPEQRKGGGPTLEGVVAIHRQLARSNVRGEHEFCHALGTQSLQHGNRLLHRPCPVIDAGE